MFVYVAVSTSRQTDEERLLQYLFRDYNPAARPVLNSNHTVQVRIQFSLMHIQELVSAFHRYSAVYLHIISHRAVCDTFFIERYGLLYSRVNLNAVSLNKHITAKDVYYEMLHMSIYFL